MALKLAELKFEPADIAEESDGGSNVGSYLRAGSDGDLLSSTNNGGKESLDVNVTNAITATLDASYVEDTAAVDGANILAAGAVRHDANTSTVDADGDYSWLHVGPTGGLKTELISQAGNSLAINADGSLNVQADISVVTGSDKAEDSASASGDIGSFVLAVRQDTLANSTSTDGDYAAFKLTAAGALWTAPVGNVADDAADVGNPVKVGGIARATAAALDLADAADRVDMTMNLARHMLVADMATQAVANSVVTVSTTAAVIATALVNRKRIEIFNDGSKAIYVGSATVTADDTATGGWKIPVGDSYETAITAGVDLFAIVASTTNPKVRIIQYA